MTGLSQLVKECPYSRCQNAEHCYVCPQNILLVHSLLMSTGTAQPNVSLILVFNLLLGHMVILRMF